MTQFQLLPLFVRVAIERLDADNALRNSHTLDALLDSYAKTYGTACADPLRETAHKQCIQRFGASYQFVGIGIRL